MAKNTLAVEQQSSKKRNSNFVIVRRGLKEHLHRSRMSSNASTLFVWLLLSAHHFGPKRGYVEANYDDLMRGLGWSYSMVRRTIEELWRKDYIYVMAAANQHKVTTIEILKFDLEECDSAVSTSEHTKQADDSAVPSGVLSAVSTSEQSTEHSNPRISHSEQDLQAPKKSIEVKKEKNERLDAVRRPFDAERRSASSSILEGGGSPLPNPTPLPAKNLSPREKRKKLDARLAEQIRKNRNEFDGELDDDEYDAFYFMDYQPGYITIGFIDAVRKVYQKHKNDGTSPGNLCSKIIDCCISQQEANKSLGGDPSEYFFPPEFVDHRNQLRAKERAIEQAVRASARTAPKRASA